MKRIIDDRGRLFGKISVIDIIVIAIVAILAAALLLRTSKSENPSSTVKTVPVTYNIVVFDVRDTSANLLRAGDKLYTNTGIYIGTIKDASISGAVVTSQLADGSYVKAHSLDRYDVMLTVETQCSVAGGRYYADRTYELCVSTEQRLVTKYVDTTGTITNITVD